MAGRFANLPPDVIDRRKPARGRILVIDDEPDIRESLEALLSQRRLSASSSPPTPPKA